MDMKQLTTFMMLMRTLNYQKAADQLQYAPSTLFKHVQLLEQELGAPLFCRVGRQMRPTQEGERFAKYAESMLDTYHQAVENIAGENVQDEELAIGGCEINTANSLLRLFALFSRQYPRVRMSMVTSSNASVPGLVRSGMIDLGYYYSIGQREYPGLHTVCLYREPVYLMAARAHPMAGKKRLTYEQLAAYDFVHPHDNCCFVVELMPRLKRRGVSFRKNTYLGGVQLVVEYAHEHDALMLIPHSAIDRFMSTYGMVPLDMAEEPLLTWESLLYREGESLRSVTRALIAHSTRYAKEMVLADSERSVVQGDEETGG